jgi:hypothetical protein
MRFLTIAMSTLGLAGLTVGEAIQDGISSSYYSLPPATSLSRWHPTVTNVPTRSIHATPVHRRELTTLTLTEKPTCSYGSTTRLELGQTSVCTEPATISYDERPCATSWYKFWICTTTNTRTTWDWGGRRTRWVAQVAARSTQDPGGRSQRTPANFAARSTQDLGGRSQRAVARFAEPTVTPAPTPAIADAAILPIPLCSFDLSKGEYVCPEVAHRTLPICSFDLKKGEYVCPKVAAATPTAAAACPEGVEMCVPRNEVAEPQTTTTAVVCPEGVEMCIPHNEVAMPQTTFDIDSHATTMQIVNKA